MAGDTVPHVVEGLPGVLQLFSDGSIVRGDEAVLWPKAPLLDVPGVQWKDVLYHPTRGLSVRVYRPESADFTRTFITGASAGANLAHHVTVHAASTQTQLAASPLRVVGYVLLSAFFGGSDRTPAEANPPADVTLTVEGSDKLWRISLPVGASRDHPLANPPFGPESPSLAPVDLPPVLVVAPEIDVLRDRVLGYAARFREMGKAVEIAEFEGERHGFSVLQPFGKAANELMRVLRQFVYTKRPIEC